MADPTPLFDRAALQLRRSRAMRNPALFLQERAADDIQERLEEVNRVFTAPAVVTPFPQVWEGRLPGASLVSDHDTLDLRPGAHDLVVHALSLHWANDPVGQLIQCRRALREDGLLIVTLFGGNTLGELRDALTRAEVRVAGGLSPRVSPMGEIRDLGGLLQRAGLALPVADSQVLTVSYAGLVALMRDLRAMGETNVMTARDRRPTRRAILTEAARLYPDRHARPDGRIAATFEVVTLTGWAPAPDQPKPLRPGSASHRLADVLGTDGIPTPNRQD